MSSSVEDFETEKIKTLRHELDSSQKKAFTKWVNATLKKVNLEIDDLFQDLTNGKILIKLLEVLSGEKLGRPSEGILRVQKADNINKCLEFLKTKVNIGSIGAEDIMDGNQRLTLGLIWTIILRLHVNEIETEVVEDEENTEKQSATDSLLLWCQRVTAGYPGVKITNFSNSWRNGLGFNALIHAHRPDLIVFEDLDPDNHVGNLNNAFDVASEKLGISKILDADDVDVPRPDEKVIITYVASFYHYFPHIKREITEPVKGFKKSTNASDDANVATLDKESHDPPTTFILNQHKTDNDEEVPPHPYTSSGHSKPSVDTIDRQVLQTVDDHAHQVSQSDHSNLKHLIWDLIDSKNITDELEKCRVLFRWLASTNLKEMSFENVQPHSPEEVLLGLKTEQATYARVFEAICNCAGLSSKIIHGYVKGAKYRPGEKFKPGSNRHSWNAVCIYDTWCLVDAKWGARSIIGKPNTTEELYELDEYYFLTEPAQFIFSHFPDDPNWQLLEKQISLEEFENMPYVYPTFFKYGLKFVSNGVAVVHARSDISISLRYPTNRIDLAFVFIIQLENGNDEYNGVKLNRYGMLESVGGLASCRLRFPETGSYKLFISVKEETPENTVNVYSRVCELKIVQEEVNSPQPKPFPPGASSWGPGDAFFRHGLTTALQKATVVTRDGKAELQFKIPKPMQFMTTLRSNMESVSELEGYCISWIIDDTAYFSITAPGRGEYGLEIYATDPFAEVNNLLYIAKYLIECNEDVETVPLPKLPEGYLGAQPQFVEYGLKTQSNHCPVIDIENNNVEIMLTTSQKMQVTADLIDAKTDKAFPEFVFVQNRGSIVSFIATLPAIGFYKFQLHAIPVKDGGQHLPNIYNYLINCKKITQQPCPFPKQYVRWKRGCYMEAPLILRPNSGDEVLFRVIIPKATSVEVRTSKERTKLPSPHPAVFEGRVMLAGLYGTDATVTLRATFGEESTSFTTLLKYRI